MQSKQSFAFDEIREECGVFGVFGAPEAAKLTYLGLYALQHRGQEGAGIVSADRGELKSFVGLGLVSEVFPTNKRHRLGLLTGDIAIGHVRYSTFGSSTLKNVQPLAVNYARGALALAHNGNLVNAARLREELEEDGAIFHGTTDSEVIVHLIARSKEKDFAGCVIDALNQVIGAYSLLVINGEELVAVRDPRGFRPLWLGRLGGAYVFASETCALDIIDAEHVREVEPGEMLVVSRDGLRSLRPFPAVRPTPCIFEFVYVERPDSVIFGRSVDEVRKRLGANLAKLAPVDADLVMAVPDSSNQVALGYAHEAGLPFDMGFIRNHYVGRTFIEPDQNIRDFGVKIKLNPSRNVIEGKRIVLVDDSIVRGTTSRKIIKMLRRCGVREIHFRISCPPIINSCFYGIDTPKRENLIGSHMSVEEIRQYLGVDSLVYQTLEGLVDATGYTKEDFCLACFNNEYPTPTPADFEPRRNKSRIEELSPEISLLG
ncbi:MAG TPA: amidophosphoribosyltransferase [Candidatus Hydrogenedentes bacterium]|nr:amidophosphoribosyltransferase [Candidatus Hydrogenedentota bacterium]HOL77774.1 amidophosphoribosyltransferase [Candidatus Hydrogenedentota bacterium]HPO86412.1 amidophosphoribosyltransferase [Candidatus Hydrogenedentota bacterium]